METISNDDVRYVTYCQQNPDDYVANTHNPAHGSYVMIHRIGCSDVRPMRSDGKSVTVSYIKQVSDNLPDLVNWSRVDLGREPALCRHCQRRGRLNP